MESTELKPDKPLPGTKEEVLQSIRISKIILPILLGVAAVLYLAWRQFNPEELSKVSWSGRVLQGILLAFFLLLIRHLAYAARLRILSQGDFSWRKCIELIFIWEFSAAVSPTSVGGSAVAFFVLAQEKLPAARTATIVLYTIILDTLFFILSIPILLSLFGLSMIRPDLHSLTELDAWGTTFFLAYFFMFLYGFIFFYGLFINPVQIKRLLFKITNLRFLKRFRKKAILTGTEMILASFEMRKQHWSFHLKAFAATIVAWSGRFLLLAVLIAAFKSDWPSSPSWYMGLYARLEAMFVIIAFSPTPGGSGFVEVLFGGFLTDYVANNTNSILIATIWRLMTYYLYLLAGAIVIPNWIREVLNYRKQLSKKKKSPISSTQNLQTGGKSQNNYN